MREGRRCCRTAVYRPGDPVRRPAPSAAPTARARPTRSKASGYAFLARRPAERPAGQDERRADGSVPGRGIRAVTGGAVPGCQAQKLPRTSCFSSSDARVAADNRRGITHCHEKHGRPWTGAWTERQEFPALLVPSVRSRGVISAARAPAGPERTYGKEKVYGSIP